MRFEVFTVMISDVYLLGLYTWRY